MSWTDAVAVFAAIASNTIDAALIIGALILLLVLFLLWRVMGEDNGLEWYQFISSRNAEGKNVADIDKLGKVVGIALVVFVVVRLTSLVEHIDALGVVAVLTAVLAYLGAVSGYAAYLRSKQDTRGN